jgi:hypothetical protein
MAAQRCTPMKIGASHFQQQKFFQGKVTRSELQRGASLATASFLASSISHGRALQFQRVFDYQRVIDYQDYQATSNSPNASDVHTPTAA